MNITLRPYEPQDLPACTQIWNEVLAEGVAFPGEEPHIQDTMAEFLAAQNGVTCAVDETGKVQGFYILHPNNIGRCAHVANASYCVAAAARGKGVGKALVPQSIVEAKALGFKGLQFNAVVVTNEVAIKLYLDHGFVITGTIPGGYRMGEGDYRDMHIMYRSV